LRLEIIDFGRRCVAVKNGFEAIDLGQNLEGIDINKAAQKKGFRNAFSVGFSKVSSLK
jgi:hypothetical protein